MFATLATTELILILSRCALGGLFVVAASAKAFDRNGATAAAVGMGVNDSIASRLTLVVILAELVIGLGLVITPIAVFAAAAAVLLLSAFSVVIAVNLRAGRHPSCNCFGQHSSAPIGATTLVRNAALSANAIVLLLFGLVGGENSLGRFGRFSAIQAKVTIVSVVAGAIIVLHSWLLMNLMRQNGRLLARLDQLEAQTVQHGHTLPVAVPTLPDGHARQRNDRWPIGALAPRFGLADVTGRTWNIDDLLADARSTVLVFLETRCVACIELAAEINLVPMSAARPIVAVVHGERSVIAEKFAGAGFAAVLVDAGAAVSDRFGVVGTPSAVLINPEGTIGSVFAQGRAEVARLVSHDRTASFALVDGEGRRMKAQSQGADR